MALKNPSKIRRFFTTLLLLLLAGCGKASSSSCAGSHNGRWTGTSAADRIDFEASCTFNYAKVDGSCASAGTYAAPLGSSGTVAVTIASVTGAGCLPVGVATCSYALSTSTLSFDCGAGAYSYSR